jgi:hypothetical protein
MLLLAAALATLAASRAELAEATTSLRLHPWRSAAATLLLGLALALAERKAYRLSPWMAARLLYFLVVAVAEEWIFRIALPGRFSEWLGWPGGVAVAALAFGGLHSLTLRYPIGRCIIAALAGLLLSIVYSLTRDFVLIALLHWSFQPIFARRRLRRAIGLAGRNVPRRGATGWLRRRLSNATDTCARESSLTSFRSTRHNCFETNHPRVAGTRSSGRNGGTGCSTLTDRTSSKTRCCAPPGSSTDPGHRPRLARRQRD